MKNTSNQSAPLKAVGPILPNPDADTRPKKTYLTIDLDYWLADTPDISFLRRVVERLGTDVSCAVHHHHILGHVAAYNRASRLINIDAHSDLPEPIVVGEFEEDQVRVHNQLNTGSWAIYVDWPHRELFSWIAPAEHTLHEGQMVPPWYYGLQFCDTEQMDEGRWDRLEGSVGNPPDYGVNLADVIGASIVLSPDCCAPNAVPVFKKLVRDYQLPLLDLLVDDLDSLRITSCRAPADVQQILRLVDQRIPFARWPEKLQAELEGHFHFCCPERRLVRRNAKSLELALSGCRGSVPFARCGGIPFLPFMNTYSKKPSRPGKVAGMSQTHQIRRAPTSGRTIPAGASPGSGRASTVPILQVQGTERMLIEEIVEALQEIDIDQLPETPRADTIRGLLWALERLLGPKIEARQQHHVPFNARLSQSEARIGRAAIEEVWRISCSLLVGLEFLTPHGHVSRWGAECPGHWSPGDFYNSIQDAREGLELLARYNDELCAFRDRPLPDAPTKADPPAAINEEQTL
jgi:hypothetical protein